MEKIKTTKQKLLELKEEEKILKQELRDEKSTEKSKKSKEREVRNSILSKVEVCVNKIQKDIFDYKKLGKAAKYDSAILGKIVEIATNPNNL